MHWRTYTRRIALLERLERLVTLGALDTPLMRRHYPAGRAEWLRNRRQEGEGAPFYRPPPR